MQPQRLVGILVLAGGIVLLVMGLRGLNSFGSQVSEFFTGSPTDRAVWLTIGGILAILAGSTAAMLPFRNSSR
ncbi:MAG: DUF3185 family protein [Phycisphaerales bacterium]|nr:DUF3185 family protein [Phycisphaerales bacterium]